MAKQLKQYERVLRALKLSEIANPYPADIFQPLTNDELKKAISAVNNLGISFDRVSAHIMRIAWINSCKIMTSSMRDEFEN